jgi:tetratricopeptide (TPR) repeat protein
LENTLSLKHDPELLKTAAEKWMKVLETDPTNPEAAYALGMVYLNNNLRDDAVPLLYNAIVHMPDSVMAPYNLALTLFNDGKVIADSEDDRQIDIAIKHTIQLKPDFKEAVAFQHFFAGKKFDTLKNYSKAIKEYTIAIDTCPDISTFHNSLGLAYYHNKYPDVAEKCFLGAIKLDAEAWEPYCNLCLLYYTSGKYTEGVDFGKKAVELLRPTTPAVNQAMAFNNLALCLWKTNQKDGAIEMEKKAIESRPDDPMFQINLKGIMGQ